MKCPICNCEEEWIEGDGGVNDIDTIYMDWICGNCGSKFKAEYNQIDLALIEKGNES